MFLLFLKNNAHTIQVQGHILSNLSIKDHLNLRAVCKDTKNWIDRNDSLIAKNIPATVIKHYKQITFSKFLSQKQQPIHLITNLHLENESLELYKDKRMSEFLRLHSHFITTLHLKRYFVNARNENQRKFLETLTNLKSFEMDEMWLASSGNCKESTRIPNNFPNLEKLMLGRVIVYNESNGEIYTKFIGVGIALDQKNIVRWHIWRMMEVCLKLVYLRVPISPKGLFDNSFDECFRLLNYVRLRTRGVPDRPHGIKIYLMRADLDKFNCCTSSLEVLLIIGARMRIQFLNVNSKIFKSGSSFCMIGAPPGTRNDYINSLLSTYIVNKRFDYVQKITIKASLIQNECIVGRFKGPDLFPHLLEIDIILDIGFDPEISSKVYSADPNETNGVKYICFPRADQILRFFFPVDQKYRICRTLAIRFLEPIYKYQKRATPTKLTTLPDIIACLPELRVLTISGWNGKKQMYLKLWQGFPHLEQLTIERCPTLNAACFVSGNGNPNILANFQFLKNLKRLELIGLETMPGMTTKRGIGINILTRFGLKPFNLLTNIDSCPRIASSKRDTSAATMKSSNQPSSSEEEDNDETNEARVVTGFSTAGISLPSDSKCLGQDMRLEKMIQITEHCEKETGEGKNATEAAAKSLSLCFTACIWKYLRLVCRNISVK
ncbi:unnamed protein product [Orchesella dallaii]|uniref:F-box domain-containing protein n=1 Tax=Orchesella dallaii TaxID=48710 RepID=A0ABP1QMG9_9HEXA